MNYVRVETQRKPLPSPVAVSVYTSESWQAAMADWRFASRYHVVSVQPCSRHGKVNS